MNGSVIWVYHSKGLIKLVGAKVLEVLNIVHDWYA